MLANTMYFIGSIIAVGFITAIYGAKHGLIVSLILALVAVRFGII